MHCAPRPRVGSARDRRGDATHARRLREDEVTPKKERDPADAASPSAPSPPLPPPPPSRRGLLAVALGLLLAGFAVALYAVLVRPDYVVLVRMDELEEGWFRARLEEFAKKRRVRLTTRSYADAAQLERVLRAETLERKSRILLLQSPHAMLSALAEEDLVRPLEDVRNPRSVRVLLGAMAEVAAGPGNARGRAHYVPATISTPLLFHSRRQVADAVNHWGDDRGRIDQALRAHNGGGLPTGYRLEPDPEDWDTYDIAVLAAYWATRPHEGLTVPRVAHAAGGEAAAQDLATRAYSHGARAEEMLELDGVALRDALIWESVFFERGWYHPSMATERWTPREILNAAAQGQVFLGWLDSADLFRLHGTGAQGLEGFLREPADLAVSRVPRGVSLELERGQVARAGDPHAAVAGTWWAIPRSAPDAALAYDLLEHVSGREFQLAWAQTFGRLPARRDLLSQIDVVFEADWQFAIARAAKKQALDYGRALPQAARWRRSEEALVTGWREACVERRLTEPLAIAGVFRRALSAAGTAAAAPAPGPAAVDSGGR
jgi:hypothetical protein